MTAIAHVARDHLPANRDTHRVTAIAGLALAAAGLVLLHYGSFAQALAALGLSPAS
ncbi:MAG: hypothetical protein KF889_11730 [Alphaproteobacteria bacterium]|nr:hypothetical protein [Alphaproteobacteria bacterium]MCW5739339.1 hypothetical protein [Alphaproteobacteria bacterium]